MAEMMADACTTLRYREPAAEWTSALPLGNGRLGAMCFGGVERDRFQLNEGTCWTGSPSPTGPAGGAGTVEAARAALAVGDVRRAEELLRTLQGGHSQAYQPLVDLWIEQPGIGEPEAYQRHLDLRTAVASHTHHGPGGRVGQEAWIGAGIQALVVRRRVQAVRSRPTYVGVDSPHPIAARERVPGGFDLVVRMPSDIEPLTYDGVGVTAVVGVRVLSSGLMTTAAERLRVDEADEVIVVVSVVTDYADPVTAPHGDVAALRRTVGNRLEAVAGAIVREGGYVALRAAHERDHRRLFSRAGLRLGPVEATARLDTPGRVEDPDPELAALQFQYGRYLMIAGSRAGGLPLNLQGLWNEHRQPPWNGNYTTNINLEMNYWAAEVANLAECHRPLFDWLRHFAGRPAPYGLDGWTLHHNSDAWCFDRPAGEGEDGVRWSFWPLAGAWLSRHVWEHYDFGRDEEFLRTVGWPLLRGAALFCLGWLTEMPDKSLGTSPSTSPENQYISGGDGRAADVSVATTADLVLIRDLLAAVVRLGSGHGQGDSGGGHSGGGRSAGGYSAGGYSGGGHSGGGSEPDEVVERARAALTRIPAERIGGDGRLAEWSTDVEDAEPAHRHTSHLIGVYPGHSVDPDDTPDLADAAARSLDARGPESTGWSLAWRIALRARLRDPEGAAAMVRGFLRPATGAVAGGVKVMGAVAGGDKATGERADGEGATGERAGEVRAGRERSGVYPNLFCAHPPFQIDGNFGFTAGVAEMLLQSQASTDEVTVVHLLPALPAEWAEGAFAGFRARGGVTVDATWSHGSVCEVRLVSDADRRVTVRYGDRRVEVTTRAGVPQAVQLLSLSANQGS